MKITINYESSWRNSFLDGSNNEPLPKTNKGVGRNFVGSMTSLKKAENFIEREVTLDTVMGVLNRLIGDQRKLYQARSRQPYFFRDIEPLVEFVDKPNCINHEMTYIRNITGSTDQNSFTGAVKANEPIFSSDYSMEFWGVLELNISELIAFILYETEVEKITSLYPTDLAEKMEELSKSKALDYEGDLPEVIDKINSSFPEMTTEKQPTPFVEKNGKVKPIRLYAASLYLQQKRLGYKYDTSSILSERGTIPGFSKRGFNGKRDFMTKFTTGKPKKVWGNPYIRTETIKGVGKVTSLMKKASGTLEINLPLERAKAKELEEMIVNAGVSSFYLGKKGLAYLADIRV